MEGLLIDEALRKLPLLPSKRLSWRFPDAHTFVLPLDKEALWLFVKPPTPRLALKDDIPPVGKTYSGFQDLLVARAVGDVLELKQEKLDRLVYVQFGAGEGFVPTPPVRLVFELTGRNCNLILLNEKNVILGAARDVSASQNRFRQVRAGITYSPPPPYQKLDPRTVGHDELLEAVGGQPLSKLRTSLDGIGPDLSRTLAVIAGLSPDKPIGEDESQNLYEALQELVASPMSAMQAALKLPDLASLRAEQARANRLERLKRALQKELKVNKKQLEDIDKVRSAAQKATEIRQQADVLMAYAHSVPDKASHITLTDFGEKPITLQLDPKLSATQNAQRLYERAKKREVRSEQADLREPELKEKGKRLSHLLAELESKSNQELDALLERYAPKKQVQERTGPGIRYSAPHGFTVLVGRSSKDNDYLTMKLAKSRDIWLHVQGYRGSHVIIQAHNKEVPFETIVFAAKLAAAYSKAAQSDNVPVDYTQKKHVWKPKGAAPGAVHYSQQKTVYVTPSRSP